MGEKNTGPEGWALNTYVRVFLGPERPEFEGKGESWIERSKKKVFYSREAPRGGPQGQALLQGGFKKPAGPGDTRVGGSNLQDFNV